MKIVPFVVGLVLSAVAASGCSREARPRHAPSPTVAADDKDGAKPTRFMTEPSARAEGSPDDQGSSRYVIELPTGAEGKTKAFTGTIGGYGQATFEKTDGLDPDSPDLLYVVSPDRDADTLIAIHYADGGRDSGGTAYAFKRLHSDSPFRFSWMAFQQTSKSAIELDTYMNEQEATINEALQAQRRGTIAGKPEAANDGR